MREKGRLGFDDPTFRAHRPLVIELTPGVRDAIVRWAAIIGPDAQHVVRLLAETILGEREACARLVETMTYTTHGDEAAEAAAAIRARGSSS